MSTAVWLLIGLVLVGAIWLCLHVLVVWQAMRPKQDVELAWKWRALALVPVAAPVIAWVGKHRVSPVLWGVCGGLYAVLWVLSGTV